MRLNSADKSGNSQSQDIRDFRVPGLSTNKKSLLCVLLFAGFFLLYQLSLALQSLSFPPERHFGRIFFSGDNMMRKVQNVHRNIYFVYSKGESIRIDFLKHPLYLVITLPLYYVAEELYAWAPKVLRHNLDYAFPSALLGACNVCLCFLIFMWNKMDWRAALGFTLLYGFSMTNWFFSSFPETYALTALCTSLFFALLLRQTARDSSIWPVAGMQALACYASPQQIFLAVVPCVYYLQHGQWSRQAILRVVKYGLILAFLFAVPYWILIKYSNYSWDFPQMYLDRYGRGQYLLEPFSYLVVFVNFFLFSVIGPVISPDQYKLTSLSIFQQVSWLWVSVVAVYLLFVGLCLRRLQRLSAKATILIPAILTFLLGYTVFFVFFNPEEAILYSLPMLFPWFLVLHSGLTSHDSWQLRGLLAILVVGTAANNFKVIMLLHDLNRALAK